MALSSASYLERVSATVLVLIGKSNGTFALSGSSHNSLSIREGRNDGELDSCKGSADGGGAK